MEISEAIERIRVLAPHTCDPELGEAATKLLLAYEADEEALGRLMRGLEALHEACKEYKK